MTKNNLPSQAAKCNKNTYQISCFALNSCLYLSFLFLIRRGDSYLKAVLVTVLLLLQLFSCRHRGAWLVLFWDKENGPCEPRYSVLSDDLYSVLKLLHQDRYFFAVCCPNRFIRALSATFIFRLWRPYVLRGESFLSLSIYLLLDWRKRLRDFQFEIKDKHMQWDKT